MCGYPAESQWPDDGLPFTVSRHVKTPEELRAAGASRVTGLSTPTAEARLPHNGNAATKPVRVHKQTVLSITISLLHIPQLPVVSWYISSDATTRLCTIHKVKEPRFFGREDLFHVKRQAELSYIMFF